MKTPIGLTAKLPVIDLFKEAIELLWLKHTQVIKIFLPIVVLMAFLDWASDHLIDLDDLTLKLIFISVSALFSVLFATAGHQFTLLPEQQRNYSQAIRAWGANEFRYLLRSLQIGVVVGVMFLAVMLGLMLVDNSPVMAYLAAAIAVSFALYFLGRLSIVLPEAALGKVTSIKRAWGMSEGNGIRLCLVVVVIPVLSMLPFLFLFYFDNLLLNYVAALGTYLTTLISVVTLSLSYRFLSEFYDKNEFTA